MTGPVCVVGLRVWWIIQALVRVGAEIIALGLEKIGGQTFAAIRVVEGECSAESGHRDSFFRGHRDDVAPRALCCLDGFTEKRVEQEIRQLGIMIESFL